MAGMIVILDDDSDRVEAMVGVLARRLPTFAVATFGTASDIIVWFEHHLADAALISLDHDLIPASADAADPGTGRDVAEYLATRSPVCHVIIHTTNSLAAPGMEMVLNDSGWRTSRVCPYSDLLWIGEWWIREVVERLSSRE